jgi:hypothetical protein
MPSGLDRQNSDPRTDGQQDAMFDCDISHGSVMIQVQDQVNLYAGRKATPLAHRL